MDNHTVTVTNPDGSTFQRPMTDAEIRLQERLTQVREDYIDEGGLENDILARLNGGDGRAAETFERLTRQQGRRSSRRSRNQTGIEVSGRDAGVRGLIRGRVPEESARNLLGILALLALLLLLALGDEGEITPRVAAAANKKRLRGSQKRDNRNSLLFDGVVGRGHELLSGISEPRAWLDLEGESELGRWLQRPLVNNTTQPPVDGSVLGSLEKWLNYDVEDSDWSMLDVGNVARMTFAQIDMRSVAPNQTFSFATLRTMIPGPVDDLVELELNGIYVPETKGVVFEGVGWHSKVSPTWKYPAEQKAAAATNLALAANAVDPRNGSVLAMGENGAVLAQCHVTAVMQMSNEFSQDELFSGRDDDDLRRGSYLHHPSDEVLNSRYRNRVAHSVRWLQEKEGGEKKKKGGTAATIMFSSNCQHLDGLVLLLRARTYWSCAVRVGLLWVLVFIEVLIAAVSGILLQKNVDGARATGIASSMSLGMLVSNLFIRGFHTSLVFAFGVDSLLFTGPLLLLAGCNLIAFIIHSKILVESWKIQMLASLERQRAAGLLETNAAFHEAMRNKVAAFMRILGVSVIGSLLLIRTIYQVIPESLILLYSFPWALKLRHDLRKRCHKFPLVHLFAWTLAYVCMPFALFGLPRWHALRPNEFFVSAFDSLILPWVHVEYIDRIFAATVLPVLFLASVIAIGQVLGPRWFVPVGLIEHDVFDYHMPPKVSRYDPPAPFRRTESVDENTDGVDEPSGIVSRVFELGKQPRMALLRGAKVIKDAINDAARLAPPATITERLGKDNIEGEDEEGWEKGVATTNIEEVFGDMELPTKAENWVSLPLGHHQGSDEPTFTKSLVGGLTIQDVYYSTACVICMFPLYIPWELCVEVGPGDDKISIDTTVVPVAPLPRWHCRSITELVEWITPLALHMRIRRVRQERASATLAAIGPELTKKLDWAMTPCKHIFHENCLRDWIDIKPECPTCRAFTPEFPD